MSVRTLLITVAAVVAGLANVAVGTSPAYARMPSNQVTVSLADLNLDSAAGRATLDRRLAGAVRQVCSGFTPARFDLRDTSRACADEAFSSAAAQRDAIVGRRVPNVSVSTAAY